MPVGVIHVTQNHYPERLGLLLAINPPWLFHQAFKVLKKLVDPKTVAKVQFVRGEEELTKIMSSLADEEVTSWLLREVRSAAILTLYRSFPLEPLVALIRVLVRTRSCTRTPPPSPAYACVLPGVGKQKASVPEEAA